MKQKPLQTLTIEESDTLLAHLWDYPAEYDGKLRAIRDSCMALLMLDAGLRVSEVIGIQRGDVCWQEQIVSSIRVQAHIAKKGSGRLIPVTVRLTAALELIRLNIWIPRFTQQDQTAFFNLKTGHSLTKQAVSRIIRQAGRVSLHRDIHPHMLRHTFGTNLMRTTNARVVQQLLGHKNLSSTQIYCHPNQQDLKKAIDSLPAGKS
ncbi:Tyrosine recombinase XerC [subsurface metagenome]